MMIVIMKLLLEAWIRLMRVASYLVSAESSNYKLQLHAKNNEKLEIEMNIFSIKNH